MFLLFRVPVAAAQLSKAEAAFHQRASIRFCIIEAKEAYAIGARTSLTTTSILSLFAARMEAVPKKQFIESIQQEVSQFLL